MKKKIFYSAVLLVIIFILSHSGSIIYYTKEAMNMCYEVIIPTLFPFFVCSGLLIYSGFGTVLAGWAKGVMRPLFNVAPSGAAAFVLGIISGFPLGALTASQLYGCGSLSKSEAERLLAFCNNSGPLFIIGSIGVSLYSEPIYGLILYIIHILSSVAVGIIFRRWGRDKHNSPPMRLDTQEMPLTEAFANAISNASRNIITVCFSIIFFSALSRALLDLFPMPPVLDALISGLCEFSTGTLKTAALNQSVYQKLILTAFIVSFSGLCVHIQVIAVTVGSGLSLKPYILGKLLHGTISAAICTVLLRFIPSAAPAFAPAQAMLSGSFAMSAALPASAVLFIGSIGICIKYAHKKRS